VSGTILGHVLQISTDGKLAVTECGKPQIMTDIVNMCSLTEFQSGLPLPHAKHLASSWLKTTLTAALATNKG